MPNTTTRTQETSQTQTAANSTEPVLSLLQINHDKERPLTVAGRRGPLEEASLLQNPGSRRGQPAGAVRAWWAREDLNFRPHAYQARALTS